MLSKTDDFFVEKIVSLQFIFLLFIKGIKYDLIRNKGRYENETNEMVMHVRPHVGLGILRSGLA